MTNARRLFGKTKPVLSPEILEANQRLQILRQWFDWNLSEAAAADRFQISQSKLNRWRNAYLRRGFTGLIPKGKH